MTTQWSVGTNYAIGTTVIYDNLYYVCINAHTSQSDWFPCIDTASLWTQVSSGAGTSVVVPVIPVVVPVTPSTGSGTIVAPYLYTWGYNNSTYKINCCMDIINKTKGSAATLAFVIAGSGNTIAQDIYAFTADIKSFIAAGGKPIISFGGADGTYIEQQLSITDMVLQISKLIDTTGCHALDFDIEGNNLTVHSLNDPRSKAIAQLQAKYAGLYVSFTLPVDTNGLTSDGTALLSNAIANGVHINTVNIMTMDNGHLPNGQSWGTTACAMGDAVIAQLQTLWPSKSTADLYRLLGICPMIGTNDDHTVFTPNDASIVSAYAKKNNIGLISFWAINRDQVGTDSLDIYSQHNDNDYEYLNNFMSALSTVNPTPPAVTPVIVPVPVVPVVIVSKAWSVGTKYSVGDKVSQSGANYVYVNSHVATQATAPCVMPAIWKKL